MANELYDKLGVQKTATADEIKSAYRTLAKKYHPDAHSGSDATTKAQAEAKFKEVQHAYDILSDPQKKASYDRLGGNEEPQGGGFGGGGNPFSGFHAAEGGGFGFDDILSNIFDSFTGGGGRRERTPNGARDGDDIEIQMNLTFEEAAFGCKKELNYVRNEKCTTCGGSGAKSADAIKTCPKCNGRGSVVMKQNTMFGTMQSEVVCNNCGGTGKIITDSCKDCKGKGVNQKPHTITFNVPAGVDNGNMLPIRGEGSDGTKGGGTGNLIIIFRVKEHPLFVRNGINLKFDLPINFAQAVLGAKVEIPTLYGRETLNIPAGTTDGTVLTVKGKGIKNLRSNDRGDLFIRIQIDVPKGLDTSTQTAISTLINAIPAQKSERIERYKKLTASM